MTPQAQAFLAQARSDFRIFQLLRSEEPCHWLHYLQMSTEKLGKAYFWTTSTPPKKTEHAYFVLFFKVIGSEETVRDGMDYDDIATWQDQIDDLRALAYGIETLAPAIAKEGENVEYPHPRSNPITAPVNHTFAIEAEFATKGQTFVDILEKLLNNFDTWF